MHSAAATRSSSLRLLSALFWLHYVPEGIHDDQCFDAHVVAPHILFEADVGSPSAVTVMHATRVRQFRSP